MPTSDLRSERRHSLEMSALPTSVTQSVTTVPAILRANAGLQAHTPQSVRQEFGSNALDAIDKVIVHVRGTNDDEVCNLVGLWSANEIKVEVKLDRAIRRPLVELNTDQMIFGLEFSEAYEYKGSAWVPTQALLEAVQMMMGDDEYVSVRF